MALTRPLTDLWDRYDVYTEKASDRVRTSAIAGLAATWLFSGLSHGDLSHLSQVATGVLIAGSLFAASLAFDILHYLVGGLVTGWFAKRQEQTVDTLKDEVTVTGWLGWTPRTFYALKTWTLVGGYGVLTYVLASAAT